MSSAEMLSPATTARCDVLRLPGEIGNDDSSPRWRTLDHRASGYRFRYLDGGRRC